MHEPILHPYPQSPFSEKVRLTLGLKKLAWRAVEQRTIMPKPDLLALPNGRRPGDRVGELPDDYGRDPVVGELVAHPAQEIALRREDARVGEVVVHFPRAGFMVVPV